MARTRGTSEFHKIDRINRRVWWPLTKKCTSLSTSLQTTKTRIIIQGNKRDARTEVSVESYAIVADSGNCRETVGTDKRENCAGISEHDKAQNNKFI